MNVATLSARATRVLGEDRVRYVLVSAAALALDALITLNLTWSGIAPALSATVGYTIGLTLHWVLSARFVFAAELAGEAVARRRQAALFFLSGLGGLAVTVLSFTSAIAVGVAAAPAKAFAVGASFCIVYLIRRHLIFPQRT